MNTPSLSRRTFLGTTAAAFCAVRLPRVNAVAASPDAGQPVTVGSEKQLFFDERFIAQSENVAITMNPPLKRGPVLKPDKPWEDFRFTSY